MITCISQIDPLINFFLKETFLHKHGNFYIKNKNKLQ